MLQDQLDLAIATLLQRHPDLAAETIAATVIDLATGEQATHQGEQLCYPASVVKLFYLAATYAWVEAGQLTHTPELEAARQAMIQASSNDATAYIVDLLTDTTSGPELEAAAFADWQQKRLVVNAYFEQQGYGGLNCCQKTWSDAPYGRDRQSYAQGRRNALSTNATARLWQSLIEGTCVSAAASAAMLATLRRNLDPASYRDDPDNQLQGFLGEYLRPPLPFYAKAGETSFCRHDSAYLRDRFIVVIFGNGPAYFQNQRWLPEFGQHWAALM